MKIRLFLLLTFSFRICLAQIKTTEKFFIGIKSGASLNQITGDGLKGFHKYGFMGGFILQLKLSKQWTGSMETLFVQKGVRNDGNPQQNYFDLYMVDFSYIEVPVIFSYQHKYFALGFGPGVSYLIHQHEVDYRKQVNDYNSFQKRDISFNAEVKYLFNPSLALGVRYTNSILAIRSNPSGKMSWYNPGQQNQTIVLSLNYIYIKSVHRSKKTPDNTDDK